jgi:hypothetical protein
MPAQEGAILRFPLLLRDRAAFERRWDRYAQAGRWFDAPAWGWSGPSSGVGYTPGSCPNAERVHAWITNLPTLPRHPRVAEGLEEIVRSIHPEDIAPAWPA